MKMNKSDNKNIDRKVNSASVLILTSTLLLLGVAIKLMYIFLITKRGGSAFNLSFPFNTYLFDSFHRFTDWLVPLAYSKISNPWDVNSELAKQLPPVPYGPSTFLYLRLTSFFGGLFPFFLVLFGFLLINYKLLKRSLSNAYPGLTEFIFIALLVGFYPLHFLIDRGNTVIIGAFLISLIFFIILTKYNDDLICDKKFAWEVEFFFILLLTSKPTWGLCLLPIPYISRVSFLRVMSISAVAYLIPLVAMNVSVSDYLNSANTAYSILANTVNFSNDIIAALSVINSISLKLQLNLTSLLKYSLALGFLALLSGLFFIHKLESTTPKVKFFLALSHVLILTLLFNRPSPDYNLIIMLPAFLVVIAVLESSRSLNITDARYLALSFFLISSWGFLIGRHSQIQYWIPFRSAGLLFLDFYIVYFFSRKRIRP
jgi:hypothetical protein